MFVSLQGADIHHPDNYCGACITRPSPIKNNLMLHVLKPCNHLQEILNQPKVILSSGFQPDYCSKMSRSGFQTHWMCHNPSAPANQTEQIKQGAISEEVWVIMRVCADKDKKCFNPSTLLSKTQNFFSLNHSREIRRHKIEKAAQKTRNRRLSIMKRIILLFPVLLALVDALPAPDPFSVNIKVRVTGETCNRDCNDEPPDCEFPQVRST